MAYKFNDSRYGYDEERCNMCICKDEILELQIQCKIFTHNKERFNSYATELFLLDTLPIFRYNKILNAPPCQCT